MTDGIFIDNSNTTFSDVYGSGDTTDCFVMNAENKITERCQTATILCEKYLNDDSHVCLSKNILDSYVTVNDTTEIHMSKQVISSGLCIQYCRGLGNHYSYVIVDENKCTCGLDISFDTESLPSSLMSSVKQFSSKCSWSASKTMIGNIEQNVVALYRVEKESSNIAPISCRTYEHDLFYTQHSISDFAIQASDKNPILRVSCQYAESSLCVFPLLHLMPESSFTSEGGTTFGRKDMLVSKMFTSKYASLAYLDTYTSRTNWRWGYDNFCDPDKSECLVHNYTLPNGDFLTTDELKVVITFPKLTLIRGIWWSNSISKSSEYGIVKNIHNFEFSFPDSMGGGSYISNGLNQYIKEQNSGRGDLKVTFLSQPILTKELKLSGFQYEADSAEWYRGHKLRFSMELFGCEDYQANKCNIIT